MIKHCFLFHILCVCMCADTTNHEAENFTEGQHPKARFAFQSLLNTFVGFDPVGYGVPYNYAFIWDQDLERLVEVYDLFILICICV